MGCKLSDKIEWHPTAEICPRTGFNLGLMLTRRCGFVYSHDPPFPQHLFSAQNRESLARRWSSVYQGSSTSGPQTGTSLPPVRNQAAQQEVSGEQAKLHLYLQPLPLTHITA